MKSPFIKEGADASPATPEALYELKDALEDKLGSAHVQIAAVQLEIATIHAELQGVTRRLSRCIADARTAEGSARG